MMYSCSNSLGVKEYVGYVKSSENGMVQTFEKGAYKLEVQYKPLDFVIAQENNKESINSEEYEKSKSELEGLQYYNLEIGTTLKGGNVMNVETGTNEEYYNKLSYFLSVAEGDMRLVDGGDTLFPVLYHLERNFGGAPFNKVVLGFEQRKEINDKTLILDDRVLGIGRVKFKISKEDLLDLPKLKIQD